MSQPVTGLKPYPHIGGEPAVSAAVDRFHDRMLAGPELKDFFNGVSMSRLNTHQFTFHSHALCGLKQYSGTSMHDAHNRLATEQWCFCGVAVHLVGAPRELGVSEGFITAIAAALVPLSKQIVNTPA